MRRSPFTSRRGDSRRRRFSRSAAASGAQGAAEGSGRYHAVNPQVLNLDGKCACKVYVRQGDRYMLYAGDREPFGPKHRAQLKAKDIRRVYVDADQKYLVDKNVEENLEILLQDSTLGLEDRAELLYGAAQFVMKRLFEYRLPDRFDPKELKRVVTLVARSSAFLDQAGAYRAVARQISRNYTTSSHSVQVFYYSVGVLKTYGQDVKELTRCGLGALLHDLGKCTVPDAVLNKPGQLSDDEWALMRDHPLKGMMQVSLLPLPPEALKCILFHHERMDGQGYPSGLAGDRIPLAVRVVAVCDAFDAMTSNRPHAEGMNPADALTILSKDMAHAYDQEVVRRLTLVLKAVGILPKEARKAA